LDQQNAKFTVRETAELLRKQKAQFEESRLKFSFRLWLAVVFAVLGAIVVPLIWFANSDLPFSFAQLPIPVVIGIIGGAGVYATFVAYFRFLFSMALRRIESETLKIGAQELQATITEDFFTKLVQINFKYIEQYYNQTQQQANKSFGLCAFASITGLGIVIAGAAMMYSGHTTPAYVTAAAGVVSQFIGAVFFYLYNQTISKMGEYHQN
jgi:hypothetical protein